MGPENSVKITVDDSDGGTPHASSSNCQQGYQQKPYAAPVSGGTHAHLPHHIAEFGEVENLVHIEGPARPSVDDVLPAPPIAHCDKLAVKERASRLFRKCFQQRHIHQYWCGDTLYRTPGTRSIGPDELFLDLVIVGSLAALGHELRETYSGWRDVEKFFLLFAAVYNSWRNVVFLWNIWGVTSDLYDKICIYVCFTSLMGISLGAHGAFDDGPRPYVAISSFIATTMPCILSAVWARKEPLLKNPNEIVAYFTILTLVQTTAAVPYVAAAFVRTDVATRVLYWVAAGLQLLTMHGARSLYEWLHRARKNCFARLALNIELMVEKYDVLTMIVIGESVLGLLFEAALVVMKDNVRLATLYGGAAGATAMLYSLQTLYVNVDGPIPKGGKHAIRHRIIAAILWTQLHVVYHAALVLFATGLGLAIHDIALSPSDAAAAAADHAATAVRASDNGGAVEGGAVLARHFGTEQRWLFSAGWGASIILSGLIGAMHCSGPRAATKRYRLVVRSVVAIAVMGGMPTTNLSAELFLSVYMATLIAIALVEYTLVQMDKMGFFRSEMTTSGTMDGAKRSVPSDGDQDDSDEDDSSESELDPARGGGGGGVVEAAVDRMPNLDGFEHVADVLKQRMCKGHSRRLCAASKSKARKNRQVGTGISHV